MNLKIVFLPLLAFEMVILIDNFRYFLFITLNFKLILGVSHAFDTLFVCFNI